MRKNSNIYNKEEPNYGRKVRKFMDEPLTIRRELKINMIAAGIIMIPSAIVMIYGIYKSNKAIEEFNEEVDARIGDMKKRMYLGR